MGQIIDLGQTSCTIAAAGYDPALAGFFLSGRGPFDSFCCYLSGVSDSSASFAAELQYIRVLVTPPQRVGTTVDSRLSRSKHGSRSTDVLPARVF